MTAPKETAQDGNLPAAKRALNDAVHALTGPQSHYLEGRVVYIPSRYLQLHGAVSGESSNGGGAGSGSKSQIPFWLDAYEILNEIDVAVECWMPAFTGVPPTVGRLRCLTERGWRPQDVRQLEQITEAVTAWAKSIEELLNPKPKWTLPYPCPACGAEKAYHRDSGGDMVSGYALQLTTEGCTCAKCRAHWPQGKFLFLGRLLNTIPDNVDPQ